MLKNLNLLIITLLLMSNFAFALSNEIRGKDEAKVELYVDSSDPATTTSAGTVGFLANNEDLVQKVIGEILANIDDDSRNDEEGSIVLNVSVNGNVETIAKLDKDGLFIDYGTLKINNYKMPTSDGSGNQVLKTNGNGILTWASGSGSGVDADLLDGLHSSSFVTAGQSGSISSSMIIDGTVSSVDIQNYSITSLDIQDGATMAEILDDDGAGSGLDSDKLDGLHCYHFMYDAKSSVLDNRVARWDGYSGNYTQSSGVTIDDSSRMGINTSSPGNYHPEADDIAIYSSGNSGLTIATDANSDKSSIFFADGTSGSSEYAGFIQYDHSTNGMVFGINGAANYFTHEVTGAIKLNKKSSTVFGSSNEAKIYADGSGTTTELKVVDAAGNHTTISPHNFELFKPDANEVAPWSYYSVNPFTGKKINVDMSKAVRLLEDLTGEQLIFTEDLSKTETINLEDWRTSCTIEMTERIIRNEIRKNPWVEVDFKESLIDVPETVETEVEIIKTQYVPNYYTGKIDMVQELNKVKQYVETGRMVKRLPEKYWVDENTGKCFRPCTEDDIILTEEQIAKINQAVQLPQYVMDRLPRVQPNTF